MILLATVLAVTAQLPVDVRAGENPLTKLEIRRAGAVYSLSWNDAEDAIRGNITAPVQAGKPFEISASLQPLSGPDFEGPLSYSVRKLGDMGSTQTVTVMRKKDQKSWATAMTVDEPGEYRFEVGWTSTHHKVVRGVFTVEPEGFPRWVSWVFGIGALVVAIGVGVWIVLSRKE
ncbi:MAG: hypothetical protein ACO1OB_03825 [Archangium sp.]